MPGLKVVMPSTPSDAKGLLKYALRQDDPVMFLEHKHLYMTKGMVPDGEHIIEFGKGDIKRAGKDVTLIAWSNMVPRALEARCPSRRGKASTSRSSTRARWCRSTRR